jgi:hypothetical protein
VTEKIIQISGTPEQAERAQSLLQGFILSSKPLSSFVFSTCLCAFVHAYSSLDLINSNEKLGPFSSFQYKKMDLRLVTEANELRLGAGFKWEEFLMSRYNT